jgi:predicted ATPase/DNA-binding CsgD family transcriptional regulator/transcriptional regulator with XRE-family HTH domain
MLGIVVRAPGLDNRGTGPFCCLLPLAGLGLAGGDAAVMAEQATLGFAGLLRRLRAEAQLTQQELAKAAGLSARSVSDLERGINRTARRDTAVRLAGTLGLAEPARSLFVAAALGRIQAAQVLAAKPRQARDESLAPAGGVHGFVPALTSFVGREGPVSEVAALLARNRLVTVTGPGGSGKTRLAGEVARQVAHRFADGVWLAELAPVRDPALVAAVVASALGVREQPGRPAADSLARVLARRQLLLVLDNCEHVVGSAAGLCAGLLAACDDVRVLATSREPLRVAGEARYRLGPLGLPDLDELADVARAEAVTLFADRARRADPRFALDDQTGPAVAQLVARLDGMPLAIELAAARVEALGVAGLLGRIDDRFALLTEGHRAAADRQRSLTATVEWSYRLLDEHERRVFRAVSVFPAGFRLEAAEAVAGQGAGSAVLRLVDCSLLSPPQAGPDGRLRYVMLETLRAYGAGLLAQAGEQDGAAIALAGYALGVAEQAAGELHTGTGEVAAARWLDAEDATMRQVLAWAMQHDADIALRLALTLAPWWILRGRLAAQYRLLREAAGHAVPGSYGWCATQELLGLACLFSADLAGALDYFTGIRDAIGDRPPSGVLVSCLGSRSAALANLGRVAEAADDARRSLALARELSYPDGEAVALGHLAVAVFRAGDPRSAIQLVRQAEETTAYRPNWVARWRSNFLTLLLIEVGELAAAARVCAAGLARSREAGDPWNQARLLVSMATLDLRGTRIQDAAAHLQEALQIAARTGDQFDLRNALDCCGYLCAATGRYAEAVTVWAAHAAIFRHEGYAYPPAEARRKEESLRKARQMLEPARARAAEKRGTAMSRDTAVEYALILTAPGPPLPAAASSPEPLSARERELVTLVAQGRTNAQIAAQLYISVRTVTSHLDRIRDKTGCRRRADLTRLALSQGLI